MSTSAWFDHEVYMTNKLADLKKAEPTAGWDMPKMLKAFADAGFAGPDGAERHFEQYGQYEEVAPNAFFNSTEYYRFKAAQFYDKDPKAVTDLEAASMKLAIEDADMSAWSHYQKYGTMENINPSNSFDTEAYMNAKLAALNAVEGGKKWDMPALNKAFADAGLSALEHFMLYGGKYDGEVTQKYDPKNPTIPADFAVSEKDKVNPGGGNGQTFQLTTSADTFVGTVLEDTFVATTGTLTTGDTLDGGAGRDTLKVYASCGKFADATIKNIETFEINGDLNALGGAAGTLDASLYTGLDTVNFVNAGSSGTSVTLSNLNDGFTVGFAGATSVANPATHAYKLNYVDGATTANLTTTNLSGHVVAALAGKGLTELNITGNTNAALTNALFVTSSTVKTVDIASAGGNYGLSGGAITTVDASASTGDLYLDLDIASTAKTVKTGSGDDEVWMKLAQLNKDDKINLGGGTDMLGLTIASGGTVITDAQYAVIKAADAETVGFFIADSSTTTTTIDAASVGGKNIFLNATTAPTGTAQIVTLDNVASTQTVTSELQHGASSSAHLIIKSDEGTLGTLNVVSQTKGDTLRIHNSSEFGTLNLSGAGDVVVAASGSSVKINGEDMSGALTATGSTLKDFITGGKGNDTIVGKGGLDILTGGAGKDMFNLSGISGGTALTDTQKQMATITDFTKGEDSITLNANASVAVTIKSTTYADDTAFDAELKTLLEANTAAVTVIQYAGATYIVNNVDTTSAPVSGDQIVKLDGLLDLTGATVDSSSILTWA